ncbi:MAG: hypothetical protein GY748_16075 [Planctomycetaceae bacterium]|nr:hypothetical protein [Planctomycetaceae bacterium]
MGTKFDKFVIVPLGILDDWVFLIDGNDNFVAMRIEEFKPKRMRELVQPHEDWLLQKFPKLPGQRNNYNAHAFTDYIFALCARRGAIDPWILGFQERKRGTAWRWIWPHGQG